MFDTPWMLLTAACIISTLGLAWMALAMETHWQQVQGGLPLVRSVQLLLRGLGSLALAISLGLCMAADHVSMAALVWIMLLAAGTVAVAFTLTWRPQWLVPLVAWISGAVEGKVAK
jgi:hypothetical protein